jgi:uncharacterized protein (DUF1501 family)
MQRTPASSRRRFLQQLGGSLALGSTAALWPQLGLIPRALAQAADYRALVCIYLAGANDSYNWLVPRDSESAGSHYDRYRVARGGVWSGSNTAGLALGFNDLLPIQPANLASAFGLHPAHTDFTAVNGSESQAHSGLQSLFASGKAAFVCNAGPLVRPISKTEYNNGAPRPAQLFSHNDQELQWHVGMSAPNDPLARFGWGGRLADAITPGALPIGLSPTISIAGSARFLIGDGILPYQMASTGVNTLDNYQRGGTATSAARRDVLDALLTDPYASAFERSYAGIVQRSLAVGESLDDLLNAADGSGQLSTVFPAGNSLAEQLQVVARMIKVSRASLGATRQVFYVRYGSFDLHDGMFDSGGSLTDSGHGGLLSTLNQAIGAFWSALGEIGARDKVTTFTMSDFARTLSGNGSGSDHAWGGNLMVLGDAVRGGQFYGQYPQLQLNADDDAGKDWSFNRGQYIPTTSVDQVAATLARWMGVTDSTALDAIFPLLGNFATDDLGFMVG